MTKTPGYNTRLQIYIGNGRAEYRSSQGRMIRMKMEDAKRFLANDQADRLAKRPAATPHPHPYR